jgi:hypothetical protein
MSVQDLRPRSQDDSAFYLQNIYQLLANPNVYNAFTPPPVATPPAFSPPRYAVWVNSLWFLSLAISLTSALLATLLHQWTRRYVTITQPIQCSPHKRARIRAFFADGVDKLHLPWIIEALPILLHLSLSLFLAGLLIFLFNVNQTAFNAVVGWVALSAGVYACITFMPIFRYDSPFYAPLSSTAWLLYAGTLYAVFRVLSFVPRSHNFRDLKNRYRGWVFGGVEKAAEDTASDRSSKVDGRILEWTIGALFEDDVTERFFGAIPGFCDSQVTQTPLPFHLQSQIRQVMDGFLDRTFSSGSVSESAKISRLTICLNAAAVLVPSFVGRILEQIFDGRWHGVPQSFKMAYALRRWCDNRDELAAQSARSIIAGIIAVQRRDDRWIALAEEQFGLPDRVFRDNIPHGDSVLLIILLHVTHNLFHSAVHSVPAHWDSKVLRVLSQFDIHNTLPQLQHDFCALWNEIVEAHNTRPDGAFVSVLRKIHRLYITLHEGTYSPLTGFPTSTAHGDDIVREPSSYPLCNVVSHTSVPLPHFHTSAVSFTAVPPHLDPALAHMSPFTGHSVPHFPPPNWGTTDRLTAESSFSGVSDAQQRPVFLAASGRPVSLESQALSITSLDIAAADATQGDPDISTGSLTHPIPRPISRDASRRSEELTIVVSPVASDSARQPIPISTVSQSSPADLPLNLESPHPQSEEIPRPPGSPSSPSLLADPHLASDLDSQIIRIPTAQHDTRDVDSSTRIESFRQLRLSAVADPDISESTSLPEENGRNSNQS